MYFCHFLKNHAILNHVNYLENNILNESLKVIVYIKINTGVAKSQAPDLHNRKKKFYRNKIFIQKVFYHIMYSKWLLLASIHFLHRFSTILHICWRYTRSPSSTFISSVINSFKWSMLRKVGKHLHVIGILLVIHTVSHTRSSIVNL